MAQFTKKAIVEAFLVLLNEKPLDKLFKSNAQSRNRTSDTRIFSPLLYQLSYLGISSGDRI